MTDERDTPTHPRIHPDLHDDVSDEATSPGGRAIPPPPPNGRIDGAPQWAIDLNTKLDTVLVHQRAIDANVVGIVDAFRQHAERLTRLESRGLPTPPVGLRAVHGEGD